MDDLPGRSRNSSEVERGAAPEVVTLGKTLTGLFNGLGVTQKVYGVRVGLDNTTVCRYLGGNRVPPKPFIEQLVREVEGELGLPLQESAKETVHQQYLAALKVTSRSGEYELAVMRDELELAKREVARERRTVESLHLLLDSKEEEAQGLKVDIQRLALDWARERSGTQSAAAGLRKAYEDSAGQADSLMEQIRELKAQLGEAEARRETAEGRSASLREEVLRLEGLLAERVAGPVAGPASFEELKAGFAAGEGRPAVELARQLTDAAWSRPVAEVIEIYTWLRTTRTPHQVAQFCGDVARLRDLDESVDFLAATCPEASRQTVASMEEVIASRIDLGNASRVCGRLRDVRTGWSAVAADSVMSTFGTPALRPRIPQSEYVALLTAIRPEDRYPRPTFTGIRLHSLGVGQDPGTTSKALLDVAAAGWEELALTALAALISRRGSLGTARLLDEIGVQHAGLLIGFAAAASHEPIRLPQGHVVSVAALLADALFSGSTISPWFFRLHEALGDNGNLDQLKHSEIITVRKLATEP
ncbi:hypothetical protein ACODT3_21895 [Streptomyces sp. 4.24]|uniref:hypothetical protein n=1 Tax=Streptomyces tritrimontium TaxID=3406573 RepID=UPI003BB66545